LLSGVGFLLRKIECKSVDIVLLDINLSGKNGIDACAEIKQIDPNFKVIAISNINEHSIIQRMLQAGAAGYLLKNASTEEVLDAIQSVVAGGIGLSKNVQDIMASIISGDLPVITRREKEILSLLAKD
jgi:DNA-binding NarL/FixJ family response regulator